jgi:hypothetical protein
MKDLKEKTPPNCAEIEDQILTEMEKSPLLVSLLKVDTPGLGHHYFYSAESQRRWHEIENKLDETFARKWLVLLQKAAARQFIKRAADALSYCYEGEFDFKEARRIIFRDQTFRDEKEKT